MAAFHTCHPGAAHCVSLLSSPLRVFTQVLTLVPIIYSLLLLLLSLCMFFKSATACWPLPLGDFLSFPQWNVEWVIFLSVIFHQRQNTNTGILNLLLFHSLALCDLCARLYISTPTRTHPPWMRTKEKEPRGSKSDLCPPSMFTYWLLLEGISPHIGLIPIRYTHFNSALIGASCGHGRTRHMRHLWPSWVWHQNQWAT